MSDYRYERKYIFKNVYYKDVVLVLLSHPLLFKEIFYERTVNNIYLDTPDNSDYFNHLDGAPERKKIRIRWYDDKKDDFYLEIKSKKEAVGNKITYKLETPVIDLNKRIALDRIKANNEIPEIVKLEIKKLIPVCVNSYKRRYFFSKSGKFRVTVDRDVRFSRLVSPFYREPMPVIGNVVVVEVKYPVADDKDYQLFSKYFPSRTTKFSKFILGMETI